MKRLLVAALALCFVSTMISCKKHKELTPEEQQQKQEEEKQKQEEKQKEQELKEVLLPNQILEQEGMRFVLNYSQSQAQIHLKLYKLEGSNQTEVDLQADQYLVNYSILADKLANNTEYLLTAEFKSATEAGTFDLSIIGFTDISSAKSFQVKGYTFTKDNSGGTKTAIKIKKGIAKYTFSTLQ